MGADQLLGHGDMLYMAPGTSVAVRVHGAFVSDQEVHRVAGFLKGKAAPEYMAEILEMPSEPVPGLSPANAGGSGGDDVESDPLYDQAVAIVTQSRRASISGVQRRLKIGYNRAARMIECMEETGIVSPMENNGNRVVLAPPPPDA
jgi:S-DNA-T family DNA segregation ATPase FtsK/SpoIIIE